eukprot:2126740-Pyramimonas_sp.AAC.1
MTVDAVKAPRFSAPPVLPTHREETHFQVLTGIQVPGVRPEQIAETILEHSLPLLTVRSPRFSRGPPPSRSPQRVHLGAQLRLARSRGHRLEACQQRRQMRPLAREYRRRKVEWEALPSRKSRSTRVTALRAKEE